MVGMVKDFFDFSTPAKRFRFVAILEAITWFALIIAMIVKRVADNDGAVQVPGMVHGIVFIAFVVYPVSYGLWLARAPSNYVALWHDPIFARAMAKSAGGRMSSLSNLSNAIPAIRAARS